MKFVNPVYNNHNILMIIKFSNTDDLISIITVINLSKKEIPKKLKLNPHSITKVLVFLELENVEMININEEWHPKIDVRYVADEIIKKLAIQEERLTGNQVKFIRSYFSMPLREFGETVVHESHTAVSKWEKCENEITNPNRYYDFIFSNKLKPRPKLIKRIFI